MSSTHDPQQPSPFDRLPDELLAKILRQLPPHDISVHSYSDIEGGGPLYNERLVSRRFNAIARDLSWRGFELFAAPRERDFTRAVRVLELLPADQPVTCSELELKDMPYAPGLQLARWAARFPDVEGLSLQRCGDRGIENAISFSKLRFLSIGDVHLDLPSSAFFPGVESMDLFGVSFDRPFDPITASAFPALRRLGLDLCRIEGADSHDEDVLPPDLVAQLEYVQLADVEPDKSHYHPLGLEIALQSVPILWSVSSGETFTSEGPVIECRPVPSAAVGRYIRLEEGGILSSSSTTVLDAAQDVIAMHTHLRAVFLPSCMWELLPSTTQEEHASRQAIIDHCASAGVDLRTYASSRWTLNHLPEFSLYLRGEAMRARS
ncbi:hypothetical protein JCM8208_001677 [Rhodotorula glutinis]